MATEKEIEVAADAISCVFFPNNWDHAPSDKCREAAKLALATVDELRRITTNSADAA